MANRIEELLSGETQSLFPDYEDNQELLDSYAVPFAKKIIEEKLFSAKAILPISSGEEIGESSNFQEIDLQSIEQQSSKSIGGEWLVKQAFEHLEMPEIFERAGLSNSSIDIASQLLILTR